MSWILKQVLPVHQFEAYAISGQELFVGNEDFAIRHWNLATRECISVFKGHRGKITDLEYSDDWKALFSTSIDGRLLVWFGEKLIGEFLNRQRRSDSFGAPLFSACYYQRRSQLFVGSTGEILIFQIQWEFIEKSHQKAAVQTLRPINRVQIHSESIHRLMIASDKLITASRDRSIGIIRLDQMMVNKTIRLRQGQAICSLAFDRLNSVIWIGSIDGKLHTMTPDGLLLQTETLGDAPLASVSLEHECGLVWVVIDGRLRLLDLHNMTIELTEYFAMLEEKPVVGIENQKCFGCYFDKKTKSMYGFFNDHYVYEYNYDITAARQTISIGAPIRAITTFEHKESQDSFEERLKSGAVGLKAGSYIVGGSQDLHIMCHENRYLYTAFEKRPATAPITAITYSPEYIIYGDDEGYVYTLKLAKLHSTRTTFSVQGTVTSVHLTNALVIATATTGTWHLLTIEHFPEPPEEITCRELAHNGAINGSAFNHETKTLVTAGADGMVKTWTVTDRERSSITGQQSRGSSVFLTENDSTMTESNVVDMRQWGEVTFICWALKANRWVTSHSDGHIRIWTTDVLNCQNVLTISCMICRVTALAVDDPEMIVAALDDKTIRCFAMDSGDLIRTMAGHRATVCALGTNRETGKYVSASWDGTVKIWGKPGRFIEGSRSSEIQTQRTAREMDYHRPPKPKTALGQRKASVFQPISLYEKRKQEIERKRRRERAEYEARMRTPAAKELKNLQKLIWSLL